LACVYSTTKRTELIYIYIYIYKTQKKIRKNILVYFIYISNNNAIQNIPGRKVNILGGHSISHSKQKFYMFMCPIPNGFGDRVISLYSTLYRNVKMHSDQQHIMSLHELQSALLSTVKYSKMYYIE
jgi:hypothetical protein